MMKMCRSKSEYDFLLDGITWSYTSVNTYETCPYCFKLTYIDCLEKTENAFAQWGSLCHKVLESYFKGETELYDLTNFYKKMYGKIVKEDFPYNRYADLSDTYYEAGISYFDNYEGLRDNLEILGVEQQVNMNLNGYPFVGIIDLLFRDEKGNIIIEDHKSKNKFKNKTETDNYLKQLYLYSACIKEKYGEFPSELRFNLIRGNKELSFEFKKEEYDKAVNWFTETIEAIYQDVTFEKKPDYYFCNNICSMREHCMSGGDNV